MHGRVHHFITLAAAATALALPATASADYDLTIVNPTLPTSGAAVSTGGGVTTFTATAPGAQVSTHDIADAVAGGNDIVIESGDGTGATGSITVDSGFGVLHGLALVTNGPLSLASSVVADDIVLDAGGAVTQRPGGDDTYDFDARNSTEIWADGPVTLPAEDGFGVLALHTSSTAPTVIRSVDPFALTSSNVAGPLTVRADLGIDLDGAIVTGGATTLVGDARPPLAPAIGRGDVTAEPGTTLDAGGHPVQIWSANRELSNLAPDLTINGTRYVPGPVSVDSATELWGQRWSASAAAPAAVPFQFIYETGDYLAPTAILDLPGSALYSLNQVVHVRRVCLDSGGSGVASCTSTGMVGDLLDTSTGGAHTATLVAVDGAGHRTEVSRSYRVSAPPPGRTPITRPPPKPCVKPTSVTLKVERPKGTKSVVATLGGKRVKVKLSATRIVLTVDVRGRVAGAYPLKVTIRRSHHRKSVVRHPKVTVFKCVK